MNRSIRGFNQENIQDMNRTLLLNLLRKEGNLCKSPSGKPIPVKTGHGD